MDLSGRYLGKYELIERVGQGGMAQVYKAYQPTIERDVAVKVLYSHLAENQELLARFKREAKGLGQLRHPHIVSVIDFDSDDGWYYMVMDYIEGDTLQDYLEHKGVLPVAEALHLTAQIAGALGYAHQKGSIHRDIKPGNVMFLDEAHTHAVITDFGIARLLDNATLTMSGSIAGTPAYMSPEAAQAQKVDARSDIYSVGVVLYEMVTGRTPYVGDTPLSVILKQVTDPLPSPLALNPDLPAPVDRILQKALAKNPDERYQTAVAMRQAIDEALAEIGETAVAVSASSSLSGTAVLSTPAAPKVEATPEVAAAPATQVLSAGQAAEAVAQAPAQKSAPAISAVSAPAPAATPAAQKRRLPVALIVAGIALVTLLGIGGWALTRDDETPEATASPTAAVAAGETTAIATPFEGPTSQAPAVVATPAAAPTQVGALRFGGPDSSGSRQFALSLEGVTPPPAGAHYELWLQVEDQAPQRVDELAVVDGRVFLTGAVAEEVVAGLSGVLISIEPDFDDNPAISGEIAYEGTVEAAAGVGEIGVFTAGGAN